MLDSAAEGPPVGQDDARRFSSTAWSTAAAASLSGSPDGSSDRRELECPLGKRQEPFLRYPARCRIRPPRLVLRCSSDDGVVRVMNRRNCPSSQIACISALPTRSRQ